jgi:arylsulfatase A-like enzyme
MEREKLFWHYPHYYSTSSPASSVRHGDWKLIHYFENNQTELYNLKNDIGEQNNLPDQHPDLAAEMIQKLQTWRKEVGAQYPTFNPNYLPEKWQ